MKIILESIKDGQSIKWGEFNIDINEPLSKLQSCVQELTGIAPAEQFGYACALEGGNGFSYNLNGMSPDGARELSTFLFEDTGEIANDRSFRLAVSKVVLEVDPNHDVPCFDELLDDKPSNYNGVKNRVRTPMYQELKYPKPLFQVPQPQADKVSAEGDSSSSPMRAVDGAMAAYESGERGQQPSLDSVSDREQEDYVNQNHGSFTP